MPRPKNGHEVDIPSAMRVDMPAVDTNADPGMHDNGGAALFDQAANVFARQADRIGKLADHAAAKEGEEAGARAGLDPEFRPTKQLTIRGEAFDNAGIDVAGKRLKMDMADDMDAAYQKYGDDPGRLQAALAARAQHYAKEGMALDARLGADLQLTYRQHSLSLVRQATRAANARAEAAQRETIQGDLDTGFARATQAAYNLGLDSQADETLASMVAQYGQSLSATVNGKPVLTPKAQAKHLEQFREAVFASRMIGAVERTPGVDGKSRFIQQFRDDWAAGKYPDMDLTGRDRLITQMDKDLHRAKITADLGMERVKDAAKAQIDAVIAGSPVSELKIAQLRSAAIIAGDATGSTQPDGQIEAGNIDIFNRPRVQNADGSVSTVRSISVGIDGQEVLLPTVSDDGRDLSEQEAIDLYKTTGRHLGKFDTPEHATAYAERLHRQQEASLQGLTPAEAAAQQAIHNLTAIEQIHAAPLPAAEQAVAALRLEADTGGDNPALVERVEMMQKAVDAKSGALAKTPYSYYQRAGLLPAAPLDFSIDETGAYPNLAASLAERRRQQDVITRREGGFAVPLLEPGEKQLFMARMQAGPREFGKLLREASGGLGQDAPALFQELGGDAGKKAKLLGYLGGWALNGASDKDVGDLGIWLTQHMHEGYSVRLKEGGMFSRKADVKSWFDNHMGALMAGLPDSAVALRESALALADMRVKMSGGESVDEEAYSDAVETMLGRNVSTSVKKVFTNGTGMMVSENAEYGGIATLNGSFAPDPKRLFEYRPTSDGYQVIVPPFVRKDSFEAVVHSIRKADLAALGDPRRVRSKSDPRPDTDGNEARFTVADLRRSRLRAVGNGRYDVYFGPDDDPQQPVGSDGRPWQLDFNRLRALAVMPEAFKR